MTQARQIGANARQIGTPTYPSPLIGSKSKKSRAKKMSAIKIEEIKPKKRRKKKKVSGINGLMDNVGDTLGLVFGVAAGAFVGIVLEKANFLKAEDGQFDYKTIIEIGVGTAVASLVKHPIGKAAGLGLAANGVISLIPDNDIPTIGAAKPNTRLMANRSVKMLPMRKVSGNAYSASPLIGGNRMNYGDNGIGF